MSTGNESSKSDWMGPREWVIQKIQTETGRSPADAELLANQLVELPLDLRSALLDWWKSGRVDMDLAIEGWSIDRIMKSGNSRHVVTAFAWLGALARDPAHTQWMLTATRSAMVFGEEDRRIANRKNSH